jgi:serine/threonine protein kinase
MNIFVDSNRLAQLADFGLVYLEESTGGRFTTTSMRMNTRWTSPQRLSGEAKTWSDDVYSFACLCYFVRDHIPFFITLGSP